MYQYKGVDNYRSKYDIHAHQEIIEVNLHLPLRM